MAAADLRKAYIDLLLKQLDSCRYPSPTMLDRVEQSVGDQSSAEDYIQALLDNIGQDRFPSPQMLDRVAGLLDIMDRNGSSRS